MNFFVRHHPAAPVSTSPYRLISDQGQELAWANDFLDAQRLRQLSIRSLRAYAYDLLHFARWWLPRGSPHPLEMNESTVVAYVRDQLTQQPRPTPQTINHRLGVFRSWYRFHAGHPLPAGPQQFQHFYETRSPLGYGRHHRILAVGLHLKEPKRVVIPLSSEQVAQFWQSFRTFRDLALIALMLLNGLRSQETLDLQLQDLRLEEAQLYVLGKGNKQRVLPLAPETLTTLKNYLRLERPLTYSAALFVSLKGRHRGQAMTLAGLRSLFRHHRRRSQVAPANPHRFRHTFGATMVRAGISLPALQQLMGHAHIRTTMLYVQLAPAEVWREYTRAIQNRTHLSVPEIE